MRVVKIDRYDLLWQGVTESSRAFISVFPRLVEAMADIIVARSRVFAGLFKNARRNHTSGLLGDENTRVTSLAITLNLVWIILAHARISLFEVDIDGDRLDVVQRILLIEWQTEVALVLHLWRGDMIHDSVWLVLTRSHIDARVISQHIGILDEALLLASELLFKVSTV